MHEGTKTVDEQLAEQLKKAEEKGDVIDLTDAHESVNDQLHKHITPSDQTELNETLEKINKNFFEILFLIDQDNISINKKSEFVVYIGSHGDKGAEMADLILPGAAFTEQDGYFTKL